MNISPKAAVAIIVVIMLSAYGAYRLALEYLEQTARQYAVANIPAVINSGSVDELIKRMTPEARIRFNDDSRKVTADGLANLSILGQVRKYGEPHIEVDIDYQFPAHLRVIGGAHEPIDYDGGPADAGAGLEFQGTEWHFNSLFVMPMGKAREKIQEMQIRKLMDQSFSAGTPGDGPQAVDAMAFDLGNLLAMPNSAAMLDGAFEHAFSDDDRMIDGRTTLYSLQEAAGRVFSGPDWSKHLNDIKAWEAQSPQSPAAPVVESLYWSSYAWDARGNGFAKSITPQGQALFQQRLEKAQQILLNARSQALANPMWYSAYLKVAVGLGDRKLIGDIFDEGRRRFPGYDGLYLVETNALMPRWYGNYQFEDEMIRDAVAATSAKEGQMMYAELYWSLSEWEGNDIDLFRDTLAQWPLMQQGYNDWLQRYPQSNWVLNQYAAMACLAGDKYTYQALRSRLGTHVNPDAWSSNHSPDLCAHVLGGM